MSLTNRRKPKNITITSQDGVEQDFVIHKFLATDGMEIFSEIPVSVALALKEGDMKRFHQAVYRVVAYAGVDNGGDFISLRTKALVDSHVDDWEVFSLLVKEVVEYNASFLQRGKISAFFSDIKKNLKALASSMSMDSRAQSSHQGKQH